MTDVQALLTYGLIGLYILVLLYAVLAPKRQPDPQRGVAVGCLSIVIGFLVVLAGLFALGQFIHARWLTHGVSGICLFVLFFALLGMVQELIKRVQKGR